MKLKEFDEKRTPQEAIKQDCQPYLQSVTDPLRLFRGMAYEGKMSLLRKQIRLNDRKPKAMNDEIHNVINDYFTREFGEPFRNALFVISNSNLASSFGIVYNIFPIGEFTYLWSPKVEDLNYNILNGALETSPGKSKEDLIDELHHQLSKYHYRTHGLNDALDFKHEIMIRCKEYYALPKQYIDHVGAPFFRKMIK